MVDRTDSTLGRRFSKRSLRGFWVLFGALAFVTAIWAVVWTKESKKIRVEMEEYTREEALTLSRLLLYDLAADPRLHEMRELEEMIGDLERNLGDSGAAASFESPRIQDPLMDMVEEAPGLPDALLWERAKIQGHDIDLEDIVRARRRFYLASLEDLLESVEADLWARVTFSDHLRGVRLASASGRVDLRVGSISFEEILEGESGEILNASAEMLTIRLPFYSGARHWGEVWCVLSRSVIGKVTERLRRSLQLSQGLLGITMAVCLGLWAWLWLALLRQLQREIIRPVVTLAHRMDQWKQPEPRQAPEMDETVWLGSAFDRLLERVQGLLREREGALERIRNQQDQLLKAERLGLLERIGSGLSHELNNALNPARLRLEEIRLSRRAVAQEDVDALLDHLSAARGILEDIGAAARRPMTPVSPVRREDWLDVSLRLVEVHFRRDPTLSLDIAGDLPPVLGEPQSLIQVVVNLLLNARDAAAERERGGGKVSLSASEGEDGWVVLSVSDNGPGVPPAMVKKLFEPFASDKAHGSGLGLFLVESLLRRMRGWVRLADTGQEGSRFEIGLRMADRREGGPDG